MNAGDAVGLVQKPVTKPVPTTLGYPKAFNCALKRESPLNPVSTSGTVLPFQRIWNLSGTENALNAQATTPVYEPN
jgi:hypothetical protein